MQFAPHAGWGTVTIHPVIIGNAGTITAATIRTFHTLGIDPASGLKLAKRLAVASIKHTAEIKRARLSHGAGPRDAVQAAPDDPPADPGSGTADAHEHPPPHMAAPSGRPSSESPGEASPPTDPIVTCPVTPTDAICAHDNDAPEAAESDAVLWQTVVKRKRPDCASHIDTPPDTQPIACSRPDRACKRTRGFYAILAALVDDEPAAAVEAVVAKRGQKRSRQSALPPVVPAVPAELSIVSDPAAHSSAHRDEAPAPPLSCPEVNLMTSSCSPAILQKSSSQPDAAGASGRHEKRSKRVQTSLTIQAVELEQPQSLRQLQPLRSKRKAEFQPDLQPQRRSARQRIGSRVFDPSDPAATAGSVARRGASPDSQASLPFDPG